MTLAGWLCALIFLWIYALIATDRVHKTKAAMVGAALVLVVGLVDQHTALHGEAGGPQGGRS